jgi:hypothetical protein
MERTDINENPCFIDHDGIGAASEILSIHASDVQRD